MAVDSHLEGTPYVDGATATPTDDIQSHVTPIHNLGWAERIDVQVNVACGGIEAERDV